MRKVLSLAAALICTFLIGIQTPAHAETYQIVAEGSYIMGDGDTRELAKDRAVKDAMRIAVEKAGVYVESYSETKNFELTADQVKMVAAGLVKVLSQSTDFYTDGEWRCQAVIYAEINTDNIDLEKLMQNHQQAKQESSGSYYDTPRKEEVDYGDSDSWDGIVFDCRALEEGGHKLLNFDCRSKIKAADGRIIYDVYTLSAEDRQTCLKSRTDILAETVKGWDERWMRGENLLICNPVFLEALPGNKNFCRNIVISNEDANKILKLNREYHFLEKMNVNIVVQP